MAAKIIKGGDGAQPMRPAAAPLVLPRDVAVGGKKVLDKEIVAARSNAGQALSAAQAEVLARTERAREEAAAAGQQAFERASREARQAAVEDLLRSYCRRGDALAAAGQECLEVAGALVGKITGRPLTLPPSACVEVIQLALRAKRAKFPATLVLAADDMARLNAFGPLVKAVRARPELKLETGPEGLLKVAGGEVAVDLEMASQALSAVLGVELVEGPAEEPPAPPSRSPAPAAPADDVPVRRWTDNARPPRAPAPAADDEPASAMDDAPPPPPAVRPATGRFRLDPPPANRPPSRVVPLDGVPRPASGLRPLYNEDEPAADATAILRADDRPRRSTIPAPVLPPPSGEGTRMEANPLNSPRPAPRPEPRVEPDGPAANGTRVDVRMPPPRR